MIRRLGLAGAGFYAIHASGTISFYNFDALIAIATMIGSAKRG